MYGGHALAQAPAHLLLPLASMSSQPPVRRFGVLASVVERSHRIPQLVGGGNVGSANEPNEHPDQAYLYYSVACCESLAGRTAEAIEHLRQAIDLWEGCRDLVQERLRLRSDSERVRFPAPDR
jgi:hypothetical protein